MHHPFTQIAMPADRTKAPLRHQFSFPGMLPVGQLRLPNGIPCFLWRQEDYALVRMDIRIEAGGWFQSGAGVALATLKMLQEGTLSHPDEAWMACLDAEGCYIDSSTDRDWAVISLHFPAKVAGRIFPLVRELFAEPRFSAERLQLLKMQQRQQLSVNLEKNSYLAYRQFLSTLYSDGHPYGRRLTLDDVEGWDTGMLETFYKERYSPAHMRIFIAGNLQPGLVRMMEETLGSLPVRPEVVAPSYPIPEVKAETLRLEGHGTMQTSICMGRRLFNRTHPDWMRMCVLNRLLGGYFGSRLMTEIREKSGFAYGIYSHLSPMRHAGHLCISADVNAAQAEQAVGKIAVELRRLCEEEVPAEELERLKKYETGSLLRRFDGLFQQMERWEEVQADGMDASYWRDYFQMVVSVTSQELRQLARQYLDPDDMTTVLVGPRS